MKTFIAIGCVCTCALLGACSDDGANSIDSEQVRPPAAAEGQVLPPGSGVKLGSNNAAAPAAPAKPKNE